MKVIECSIIGSVHDGKFSNAIDKYPVTNVKAEEITAEEFKKMIAYANGKGYPMGKYAADNSRHETMSARFRQERLS